MQQARGGGVFHVRCSMPPCHTFVKFYLSFEKQSNMPPFLTFKKLLI